MSGPKIEDLRISSSSIDAFFAPPPRVASGVVGRVRIASLSHLAGFQHVSEDTLIRLSQQDFWKLNQDDQGFYIERLVEDGEGPVKG